MARMDPVIGRADGGDALFIGAAKQIFDLSKILVRAKQFGLEWGQADHVCLAFEVAVIVGPGR